MMKPYDSKTWWYALAYGLHRLYWCCNGKQWTFNLVTIFFCNCNKNDEHTISTLRFAVIELLKGFIDDVYSYEDLEKRMEYLAQKSIIAKHWINNLIRLVFLVILFVQAEQEGEFPLHLYACRQKIPYFFAAGHVNYTRYGLC